MGYHKRHFTLMTIDAGIIIVAIAMAYLLRFDFAVEVKYLAAFPYVVLIHLVIILAAFHQTRLYKRLWEYASVGELVAILMAVTVAELVFVLVHTILQLGMPAFIVPRSIYVFSWAFIVLGIGGSRFAWRVFRDRYFRIQPHQERVLIVGAGNAGAMVARDLKHSPGSSFYPVAFVDDDVTKQSLEIMGLPIVGSSEDIPKVVKHYRMTKVIIAMPSAPRQRIAEIISICKGTKANIQILPGVSDIVNGKVSLKTIRDVDVADLLGREPVKVDMQGIADYVTDEVVLVTGAGGSIGSELSRQIAPFSPRRLLLLGHGENSIYDIEMELRQEYPALKLETVIADIQDGQRMHRVFRQYRPGVVFHAAAHKHVPLMERNPVEAVKNNVLGTKNVANCAHQYGASRFVLISTDKAVNPTSVMGATKRAAEMIVQSLNRISYTKFVAVRFGNVLGSRGSVIPVFKRQIAAGGPVTVTHPEMVRYFMTIPEAVQLVIQAGALAGGGETFILDMGNPVKIADLARDLIRLSGFEPDQDIQITYTGIRPGEKLFEEILTAEEGTTATKHDRIYVGQPSDFSVEQLLESLKRIEAIATEEGDADAVGEAGPEGSQKPEGPPDQEVRAILAQLVPTVHWNRDQVEETPTTPAAEAEVAASREDDGRRNTVGGEWAVNH